MTAATEHTWQPEVGDRIQVLPDAWDGDVGEPYNGRTGVITEGPYLLADEIIIGTRLAGVDGVVVYLSLDKVRPA